MAALSDSFQEGVESDPALRRLHETRPDVRIGALTHLVFLPASLHRGLAAGDLPRDGILLPIQHRFGGRYLKRFLGGDVELASQIVQLKIKRPCFCVGPTARRVVLPLDLSPRRVGKLIAKASRDKNGRALKKCARLLGRLGRDDYARNMRGRWYLHSPTNH